jgi:hypothetical protein
VKKKIVLISSILFLTLIIFIVFNIKSVSTSYPDQIPNDFDFEIQLDSKLYVVNSYQNTLSKGLNWDYDTIISFQVTKEWKEEIYNKLVKMDISKYPENYAPTTTKRVYPSFEYSIVYTLNGATNTINWIENTDSNEKEAKALRSFFESVYKDLIAHKDVQDLPESERITL